MRPRRSLRRLRGLFRAGALPTVIAFEAPVVVFLAATRTRFAMVAAALLGGGLAARTFRKSPKVGVAVCCGAIALIPIYWAHEMRAAIATTPVMIAGLVLIPAALQERKAFQLVGLDAAVAAVAVTTIGASLLNFSIGAGITAATATQLVIPYATFRLLSLRESNRVAIAVALVTVSAGLAVIAVREHLGVRNPFFTLVRPDYQSDIWARPERRFNVVRAEASFGHPIAYGLFVATALVLTIALALRIRRGSVRIVLLGIAVLEVFALVFSLSRGPLLVAGLAVVLFVIANLREVKLWRVVPILAIVVYLATSGPTGVLISRLTSSTHGAGEAATSAQYRLKLFDLLTSPTQFSLLGQAAERDVRGDVAASVEQRTGLSSFDNEFARVYVTNGLLGLLAVTAVIVLVWKTLLRSPPGLLDRAFVAVCAATSLGLLTVALLTQHASLFWINVAVIASIEQHRRAPRAPASAIDRTRSSRLSLAR